MNKVCNDCMHLNIDEAEQNYLKVQVRHLYPHICKRYNKQVFHHPYEEPLIHPCEECIEDYYNKKGGEANA